MDNLIGTQLDRYQIISLLGEGGMGAVYKARHISLENEVAIKVMHAQYARQEAFRQRFLQEAKTAANLSHPGIVGVHDFGEDQGFLYIVMEYIPGGNLQKFLEELYNRKQWIPLNEAVQLMYRISIALDHAHRHGVLHRDIKPANIMIKLDTEERERYYPIITDLGLAKLAEGGLDTLSNATMGTPAYMSPEQAEGEKVDARSDVYSLGILLYELTVGRRPFPIRTLTEAIRYHTKEAPPPPRTINPQLTERLEEIILRSIAKEPDSRFQSARGLAKALEATVPSSLSKSYPPTAPEGAVSLFTQVQESLIGSRGQSLIQAFPETILPQISGGTHIQIMQPDGQARTIPMNRPLLVVGRGEEADVTIEDEKISRKHVSIQAEDGRYLANDLGSTNGSYLGNNRLQPGNPSPWLPNQPLRLGSHSLRLIPATRTLAEQPQMRTQKLDGQRPMGATTNVASIQRQPEPAPMQPTARSVVPPIHQQALSQAQPQVDEPFFTAPQSKSKSNRFLMWVVPLLLLLLVGIGWGAYQVFGTTSAPPPEETDTGTPIQTIQSEEAAIVVDTPVPTAANTTTNVSIDAPTEVPTETATATEQPTVTDIPPTELPSATLAPPPTATISPTELPPTVVPTSTPLATSVPATPTVTPADATVISTSTTAPPEIVATETVAAPPQGDSAQILSIEERDGRYIVNFQTSGFQPIVPGQHVHFFFNTVLPEQAGVPGGGPWELYPTGPGQPGTSPFTLYGVSDRPGGASQLCILVANQDHSVQLGTGNCVNLP